MSLMSKSAVARLSSHEDLILSAPILKLNAAKHLYISKGISYFDSEPEASNKDTIMTQSAFKGSTEFIAEGQLRAYNLVAINGILAASIA